MCRSSALKYIAVYYLALTYKKKNNGGTNGSGVATLVFNSVRKLNLVDMGPLQSRRILDQVKQPH